MEICITLDVEMAKKKMSLKELSQKNWNFYNQFVATKDR
jgi:hypothetical protein